jgi:hypothetical protein
MPAAPSGHLARERAETAGAALAALACAVALPIERTPDGADDGGALAAPHATKRAVAIDASGRADARTRDDGRTAPSYARAGDATRGRLLP